MNLRIGKMLLMSIMMVLIVGCKGDGESGSDFSPITDKLTAEFMNNFRTPDEIRPNFKGNSSPIDVTPTEGMRVTAARNAFYEDTEITVTGVSDEEFKQLDEKFAPAHVEPLLAYHLDAGLADDEVMPGTFKVEFDLKELGVPESMWDLLRCYRVGDDGRVTEYASVVKNGKLSYESAQNSMGVVGAIKWFGPWFAKAVGVKALAYTAVAIPAYYGIFYFVRDASMPSLPKESSFTIKVTDDWGSFNMNYDQQLSENREVGPKDENGKLKEKRAEEIYKRLEKAAEKEYDSRQGDYRGWLKCDLVTDYQSGVGAKRAMIQKRVDEMAKDDAELQELINDKFFQTPESVNKVIDLQCLGNRYLCAKQGLKKTWYCYDVFLASDIFMDTKSSDVQAYAMAYDGFFTFICLRNSKIVGEDRSKYKILNENINEMAVAMCHETFHLKQYHYIFSTNLTKDDRFCEATAIILERQFADYLEEAGLSKPSERSNLALTSCEGREWLAWTLEKPLPANSDDGNAITATLGAGGSTNCDIGYMLGEFIQYLLDTKKKVSLKHMWENYSNSLGFHGMLIDFFGFKTDNEFTIAYEKFCKKYMKEIVADQVKDNNGAYKRGLLDKPRAFNPRYSVQRIENICMNVNGHGMFTNYKAWAYGAKVFQFRPSQNEAKLRYNAFIVPSKSISQGMLKTVVLDSKYKYNESSCFFAEIKTARNDANVVPTNVVLFYRPAISGVDITDDWWVDVVAMYEPTQKVSVRGANDNKECISVMPNARPTGRILDKHYVTGMQILCKNNKTGRKSQISILVDDCGSAVEFPYQQLGLTKDGDIDVSFASRWYYLCEGEETLYYSPATEWVDYKRKGKEQKKEEPKPKEEEKVVPVQKSEPEPASNYSYSGSFEVFNHAGLCYDHPPVIGHVSVSGNSIKITIPAHKRTWSGGGLTSVYDASSIDVTFVGKVYYSEETKSYSIGFSDIKEIKMSSFSTKEVSDHPEDKYHSVHIEYYKEHELTKNRRIHVPTISGKELDLEFDVDCRFTWETDKDGKHTSTNDCKHNWKPYHGEWYTTWNHIQGKMQ